VTLFGKRGTWLTKFTYGRMVNDDSFNRDGSVLASTLVVFVAFSRDADPVTSGWLDHLQSPETGGLSDYRLNRLAAWKAVVAAREEQEDTSSKDWDNWRRKVNSLQTNSLPDSVKELTQAKVEFILRLAHLYHITGRGLLILTSRVLCAEMLHALIPRSELVHGGVKGAERERRTQQFVDGTSGVMIATAETLGTGWNVVTDMRSVDGVVMTRARKAKSMYLQNIGRGQRPHSEKGKRKSLLVYDLVYEDDKGPMQVRKDLLLREHGYVEHEGNSDQASTLQDALQKLNAATATATRAVFTEVEARVASEELDTSHSVVQAEYAHCITKELNLRVDAYRNALSSQTFGLPATASEDDKARASFDRQVYELLDDARMKPRVRALALAEEVRTKSAERSAAIMAQLKTTFEGKAEPLSAAPALFEKIKREAQALDSAQASRVGTTASSPRALPRDGKSILAHERNMLDQCKMIQEELTARVTLQDIQTANSDALPGNPGNYLEALIARTVANLTPPPDVSEAKKSAAASAGGSGGGDAKVIRALNDMKKRSEVQRRIDQQKDRFRWDKQEQEPAPAPAPAPEPTSTSTSKSKSKPKPKSKRKSPPRSSKRSKTQRA